jgi:DNA-binding NtrC family response regulator
MVVIVDPHIPLLELITESICDSFPVTAFHSSIEALQYIQENKALVTVCLTDYNMPLMNGSDLARRIKRIDEDIQIIMISPFTFIEVANELLNEHCIDEFLAKPFLSAKLHEAIDRRREIFHKKKAT